MFRNFTWLIWLQPKLYQFGKSTVRELPYLRSLLKRWVLVVILVVVEGVLTTFGAVNRMLLLLMLLLLLPLPPPLL